LQLAALKKASRKQVFKYDGLSGATTKRPALLRCLKKLEPGEKRPHRNNLSALKDSRLSRFLFRCFSRPNIGAQEWRCR
jgi:DNA invertase Pin-like site-specific DNA recombinase